MSAVAGIGVMDHQRVLQVRGHSCSRRSPDVSQNIHCI
jgi:hypothetical protein